MEHGYAVTLTGKLAQIHTPTAAPGVPGRAGQPSAAGRAAAGDRHRGRLRQGHLWERVRRLARTAWRAAAGGPRGEELRVGGVLRALRREQKR